MAVRSKRAPENSSARFRCFSMPDWLDPMLATLVAKPFSGADWIFEPKLDGQRCLAFGKEGQVSLFSRNHLFKDPLRFNNHLEKDGETFFAEACRQGWEGLIAKRADSLYSAGRSSQWLKLKCVNEQEFVIGGYSIDIPRRGLHWVRPELVAQVGFSEWTEEGKLRHPRFLGLRDDKDAREVRRT